MNLATLVAAAALGACSSDATSGESAAGITSAPEECRWQCVSGTGCEERPLDEYPSLDELRADWLGSSVCAGADPAEQVCDPACYLDVYEGACADGKRFLRRNNGMTSAVYYFDASGTFVGSGATTDVIDDVCHGMGYWPEPVPCAEPTLTAVQCGEKVVGEQVTLPWANWGQPATE